MKRYNFLLALLIGVSFSQCINADDNIMRSKKAINLRLDMRKLWEDHIQWTRNFIISAIADLGDKTDVTNRLLQNQDDIGDAFKPYFGRKFAHRLAELLREHILQAAAVVADAIAGDQAQFDVDYATWKKNARRIAEFLHHHNSHWSKKEIKKMIYKHLELTTDEASSRLIQDWQADIKAYDKNHIHMLMFSDVLTKGIIKEFPDKF